MKRRIITTTLMAFLPLMAAAAPNPGEYVGTITFTEGGYELPKPLKEKAAITLVLGKETTMTIDIDGVVETQLQMKCKTYHGVGSGYGIFLGEQFLYTLPMHFDQSGSKLTGSLIFSQIRPGGDQVLEGKIKAVRVYK